MWDTIKELIEGAYIGQAIIATMVIATTCFLVVKGVSVPEWFVGLASVVLTWYFREQTQSRQNKQDIKKAGLGFSNK